MKPLFKYLHLSLTALCILSSSCNKLVEIPGSKNQIETPAVFADSSVATSALLGIYYTMAGTPYTSTKYLALYADEYTYTNASDPLMEFNRSHLLVNNSLNDPLWGSLYSVIYQCNALMEGVDQSVKLSAGTKVQLKAEAKFLRAYANFYLVNLYDHIPLILTTEVGKNARAVQSPAQAVFDQVIKDLQEAKKELGTGYKGSGKVRANSWAASALLARVYVYHGRWADAEQEATGVINSNLYSPLPPLQDVFLAGSKEAILQLWTPNGFLIDAPELIPASSEVLPNYVLLDGLQQTFESQDGRKSTWIAANTVTVNGSSQVYSYPSKYKNRSAAGASPEYIMALRLSEQYLIRAEAAAQQKKIDAAVADLNVIRTRAGGIAMLDNGMSKEACLAAVAKERRLELFGEWGHRFLDLKRTGRLDTILGTLKPTWKNTAEAFPIPQNEIIYNSNLIQNHGY
nr:RagB/SusD family nutrient uptake outer membrane protein [Pedobacter sp. ASV19]